MADGAVRTVSGLRRKAVLATLALHVGEVVSTDRLADIVRGDAAPLTALNTLHSHVSYLRAVLGGKAAILARPPGCVLNLAGEGTASPARRSTRSTAASWPPTSLAGIPPGEARALLAELTRAHLLTEHIPGRHAFHDLLRAYATEQAHAHEDDEARREAIHRVLDHSLHTAQGQRRA